MGTRADIADIIRRPVPERLKAIEDIWDSIVLESDTVAVPDWHREELRRRLERYATKPRHGTSWPVARRRIEEECRPPK